MRPTIQRSLSWEEPLSTQRALRMETTLRGLNIVALIIVAIAAFLASAPRVYAQAATGALRLVTPGEMRSGALLFRGKEEGRYVQAPIVGTDVDLTVSGPTRGPGSRSSSTTRRTAMSRPSTSTRCRKGVPSTP